MEKDTKYFIGVIAILIISVVYLNINENLMSSEAIKDISGMAVGDNIALKTVCSSGSNFRPCSGAIDGNINTYWNTNLNTAGKYDNYPTDAWIKVDLGSDSQIDKIILKSIILKAIGWVKNGKLTLVDSNGKTVYEIKKIVVPYGRSQPNGVAISLIRNEYLLNVDESIIINGKKITLVNVGSDGSIIIDMDGTIKTLPSGVSILMNRIVIWNLKASYNDIKTKRSANIIIRVDEPLRKIRFAKFEIIQTWGPYAGLSEFEIYEGKAPILQCTDSDGGKNYYIAGDANAAGKGVVDMCDFISDRKGIIWEAVCEDGIAIHYKTTCPSDTPYCNRAVCSKEPPKCYDTDGGKNPSVLGTITEPRSKEGPMHTDYCENIKTYQPWDDCSGESCGLREYYCTDPYITTTYSDLSCPSGCKGGICKCLSNSDCPSGYGCSNGACIQTTTPTPKCTDSDGGKNYNQKGTATGYLKGWTTSSTVSDYCTNSESGSMFLSTTGKYLVEYYCGTDGYMYLTKYTCSNGCSNGACVTAEAPKTCIDSDGGKNYNVKGTGNGWNTDTEYVGFYDTCYKDYWANLVSSCSGDTCYLAEKYCDGKYVKTELSVKCQNGCSNGACIKATTTPKCTDSDAGVDYYVKGTATNEDGSYATDYCSSTTGLNEAFCCSSAHEFSCTPVDHSNVASAYTCPNGCKDSACTPKCTDTDGGKNYYIKGDTTFTMVREFVVTDSCSSETYLTEAWCDANLRYQQSYKCPNGCSNGACKCISDSGCPSGYTCNAITDACI